MQYCTDVPGWHPGPKLISLSSTGMLLRVCKRCSLYTLRKPFCFSERVWRGMYRVCHNPWQNRSTNSYCQQLQSSTSFLISICSHQTLLFQQFHPLSNLQVLKVDAESCRNSACGDCYPAGLSWFSLTPFSEPLELHMEPPSSVHCEFKLSLSPLRTCTNYLWPIGMQRRWC